MSSYNYISVISMVVEVITMGTSKHITTFVFVSFLFMPMLHISKTILGNFEVNMILRVKLLIDMETIARCKANNLPNDSCQFSSLIKSIHKYKEQKWWYLLFTIFDP